MSKNLIPKMIVRYAQKDFPVTDLGNSTWRIADAINITRYWNADEAPLNRQFTTRVLWSDSYFYVNFEANQGEQLIASDIPNIGSKTMDLWDRDVCEIFIAPNKSEPRKYFEFEIAPTGEWVDLAIDLTSGKRKTDSEYSSGVESSARIDQGKIVMAIKIPWKAFGKTPKAGDIWLGNLFRCIGKDPNRGYLAWNPTHSKEPNFHLPEKFGKVEFLK